MNDNTNANNKNVVQTKLDNNALFAQRLKSNPPEYEFGDIVETSSGIARITGRVFNEKESKWKYTVCPTGLKNFHMDNVTVYSKYTPKS
jgi:hypothetical protein